MDIINWEPQNVVYLAENLSKIGNQYRLTISNLYQEYNNIGTGGLWTGKDYNTIAKEVLNSSRNSFEEWSDFIQFTIPEELYQIAKMQSQDGMIDFYLYKCSSDIKPIEYSIEKSDGSFTLKVNEVKNIINNKIIEYCQEAEHILHEYCMQFEELTSIDNNAAILIMYQKITEMIEWNSSFIKSFVQNLENTIDSIIQNIQNTDEETIKMAKDISNMQKNL